VSLDEGVENKQFQHFSIRTVENTPPSEDSEAMPEEIATARGNERPGVVSIVGTRKQPAALPDFGEETLRAGLNPMRVQPHPIVVAGQRARIKTGTLDGIEGIVARKNCEGHRVVLRFDLPQSIAIEVNGEDAESVDASIPLILEEIEKKIKQSARTSLHQFNCLDSYPKSTRMSSSGCGTALREHSRNINRTPMRTPSRIWS